MQTSHEEQLRDLYMQINALRREMAEVRRSREAESVQDYVFTGAQGDVSLSALFGDKPDLFVIHNMGTSCPYCTLWADGFSGLAAHWQNRASVVLSSPDDIETVRQCAGERNWRIPVVSVANSSFAADMGYHSDAGYQPGISVFQKRGQSIVRVSTSPFGPGDDYCSMWHLLDLLPQGADGWQPQTRY